MRFLSIVVAAIALTFFWFPSPVVAEQGAQPIGGVVKVGNLTVTQTDVDLRAQKIMPMQVSFHGTVDEEKISEIKQEALDELVDRAYKIQYAINEELSIDVAAFENDWQERLAKNPQAAKDTQPLLLSKVRADLYLDRLALKAEAVAVDDKITVTDQEVSAYYAENKSKYFRPELYTASHVFVKVDPSDNAEEKAVKSTRAEELFKRAQAGEDFYNLAYYESDDRSKYVGGSLGSFHAGQTVPEFDKAIQAMKPGDIVGPVRTMYGFHIIRLDALDGERQLQFDEVAAKIRAQLEEAERTQLYEQWMSKLKEQYPLERLDR